LILIASGAACGPSAVPVAPKATPVASADPRLSKAPDAKCEGEAYVPRPAWSGRKPTVPPPPVLPDRPVKVGDAYTVHGAVRALHDRFDTKPIAGDISIVGVIVDTNLARAPKCALHKTGIADPKGCVTEIPTFTIADDAADPNAPRIRAMGWASNFANVFTANATYDKLSAPPGPASAYRDELWAVVVPYPLPAVGAKVKVTGRYGVNFEKSSTGLSTDPEMGLFTVRAVETLERAPKPAKLGP
jgi:hypothetical protein